MPSRNERKLESVIRPNAEAESVRNGQLTTRSSPAGINDKTEARTGRPTTVQEFRSSSGPAGLGGTRGPVGRWARFCPECRVRILPGICFTGECEPGTFALAALSRGVRLSSRAATWATYDGTASRRVVFGYSSLAARGATRLYRRRIPYLDAGRTVRALEMPGICGVHPLSSQKPGNPAR